MQKIIVFTVFVCRCLRPCPEKIGAKPETNKLQKPIIPSIDKKFPINILL